MKQILIIFEKLIDILVIIMQKSPYRDGISLFYINIDSLIFSLIFDMAVGDSPVWIDAIALDV